MENLLKALIGGKIYHFWKKLSFSMFLDISALVTNIEQFLGFYKYKKSFFAFFPTLPSFLFLTFFCFRPMRFIFLCSFYANPSCLAYSFFIFFSLLSLSLFLIFYHSLSLSCFIHLIIYLFSFLAFSLSLSELFFWLVQWIFPWFRIRRRNFRLFFFIVDWSKLRLTTDWFMIYAHK